MESGLVPPPNANSTQGRPPSDEALGDAYSYTLYPTGNAQKALSRQFSALPLRHSIIVNALCFCPVSPRGVRSIVSLCLPLQPDKKRSAVRHPY
jgi:hypothetical protein